MKGLLLKDIYTLMKQFKFFLLILLIFSMIPQAGMSSFAICYCGMLPITALAYDERSKWDKLAVMFPYSAEELVMSKYLLGYLCVGVAAIISLISQLAYAAIRQASLRPEMLPEMLFLICAAILLQAINLPFMFKLGVEKGRMIFISTVVVIAVGAAALSNQLEAVIQTIHIPVYLGIVIVAVASAIISVVSIMFSERVYRKRR